MHLFQVELRHVDPSFAQLHGRDLDFKMTTNAVHEFVSEMNCIPSDAGHRIYDFKNSGGFISAVRHQSPRHLMLMRVDPVRNMCRNRHRRGVFPSSEVQHQTRPDDLLTPVCCYDNQRVEFRAEQLVALVPFGDPKSQRPHQEVHKLLVAHFLLFHLTTHLRQKISPPPGSRAGRRCLSTPGGSRFS